MIRADQCKWRPLHGGAGLTDERLWACVECESAVWSSYMPEIHMHRLPRWVSPRLASQMRLFDQGVWDESDLSCQLGDQ